MNKYIGKEISGKEFNNLFAGIVFVKLTNISENHNGIQLKEGLNTYLSGDASMTHLDIGESGWEQVYISKAIDFVKISDAWMWLHYNNVTMFHMRNVTIPDDALVYIEKNKFKTNKIILGEKENICNKIYMEAIMNDGFSLKFIPYALHTKELCCVA